MPVQSPPSDMTEYRVNVSEEEGGSKKCSEGTGAEPRLNSSGDYWGEREEHTSMSSDSKIDWNHEGITEAVKLLR